MHPDHERCFAQFPLNDISIVGSSVWNMDQANDIDILFAPGEDFPAICRGLGVKYNGWDHPTDKYHVRRASFRVPGVDKPVHLLHWGDWKSETRQLFRDGSIVNANWVYDKLRDITMEVIG